MVLKIAVMMLVHKNENQVNRLVKHLSKDFDVFVHIDKNCSLKIQTISNNVFVYKKYKTYWGSFNQIMATLYLLQEAHSKGYDRYILISGQDLPIKPNKKINEFFENNNSEYIDISIIPRNDGWPDMERLTQYHQDNKYRGNDAKYKLFFRIQRKIFSEINKYIKRKLEYDFCGGSNWTNYTWNCVDKILKYLQTDKKYIKRYKWTNCADEIFYQTIIHQIEGLIIEDNSLRYIDWENGPEYPRTLRIKDYEKIMNSDDLFARKFDETVDNEIINKIYGIIRE
jgi:hypothetical protein